MKKKYKWLNIIFILLVFLLVPIFCFGNVLSGLMSAYQLPKNKLEIFELWHIETFEGGGKSRLLYLQNLSVQFEKDNLGKMVLIKNIKPDELGEALKISVPHMLSFGWGVGVQVLPYLVSLGSEHNVRDDLITSAQFNGSLMCVPYILSGYCYFTKEEKSVEQWLSAGKQIYTQNLGYTSAKPVYEDLSKEINDKQNLTSYEAYTSFVSGNAKILLGTGRDLYRTQNLISHNRLNCNMQYVQGYSDLVQYFGITENNRCINAFLNLLMSQQWQFKLKDYSLFGVKPFSLYSQGAFFDMENALKSPLTVPKLFKGA